MNKRISFVTMRTDAGERLFVTGRRQIKLVSATGSVPDANRAGSCFYAVTCIPLMHVCSRKRNGDFMDSYINRLVFEITGCYV